MSLVWLREASVLEFSVVRCGISFLLSLIILRFLLITLLSNTLLEFARNCARILINYITVSSTSELTGVGSVDQWLGVG